VIMTLKTRSCLFLYCLVIAPMIAGCLSTSSAISEYHPTVDGDCGVGSTTCDLRPGALKGKWGYTDKNGNFIIPAKFFGALPFSDGLALVVIRKPSMPLGSEYGEFRLAQVTYIDRSGREIRPPLSVRVARSFSEGLALVVPDTVLRLSGGCAKAGYLNKKGTWAIEPQFSEGQDFSEGLAAVNTGGNCGMGGRWGYVDKDGRLAIPAKFTWAAAFHQGRACVGNATGKEQVIDRNGSVLAYAKCQ
jgi:hypothetical protein